MAGTSRWPGSIRLRDPAGSKAARSRGTVRFESGQVTQYVSADSMAVRPAATSRDSST